MKVLTSDEIYTRIKEIVKSAERSVYIVSAWLRSSVIKEIVGLIDDRRVRDFKVVLRASELQDLLITDEKVFELIKSKGEIYLHPRLHAKFILVDESHAVVGSANFTYSGLSEYERGNVEVAVYCSRDESPEEIDELKSYFEKITGAEAIRLSKELIGFSMNPVKARSFEFIALEEVSEQEYVELRSQERRLMGRVREVYAYDMDFFANPFTAGESPVFGRLEDFKTLFAKSREPEWKKAAVLAYLNRNGAKVKIAVVEAVGEVVNNRLETPLSPFDVASPVYRISEEALGELLKRKFSGEPMEKPVKVGRLYGTNANACLDASEVLSKHLLILGTTGSGKSHFAKLFLSRLLEADGDVQIFILDPHGEYLQGLSGAGVEPGDCEHVLLDDTFLPIHPEEVKELLERLGYYLIDRKSNTNKANLAYLSRFVKPSLSSGLRFKNLLRVVARLRPDGLKKKDEIKKWKKEFIRDVYRWVGSSQPSLLGKISRGLNSSKRVVIFDFKEVSDADTRVNAAGLIAQELFERAKRDRKKRFLVLEEAHNFAPEKGFGDSSAGRDNLALVMARKIASEGRKFNLGLAVITQRPAQVSKFVLSQTNTQVMFRTINSSDLGAVSSFVEYAGEDVVSLLPSLKTGMGIACGIGAPFPLLIGVE